MADFKAMGRIDGVLMRIELVGELVYATSTKAREEIRDCFEKISADGRCVFLADQISRIDSTGFGVLIHFVRQAATKHVKVAVVVPDPFILDLFRIAKFDRVMMVVDSENAALQKFESDVALVLSPQDY